MSYDLLLAKLREDVAAAKVPEEHDYDKTLGACKACQGAKERGAARARIAALDGPALLECLARAEKALLKWQYAECADEWDLENQDRKRHVLCGPPGNCMCECGPCLGRRVGAPAALRDAATALGVSDEQHP